VHFELEKTNLVMKNLILFAIFIAHIYSQIYKAGFDIFSHSLGGGLGPSGASGYLNFQLSFQSFGRHNVTFQ